MSGPRVWGFASSSQARLEVRRAGGCSRDRTRACGPKRRGQGRKRQVPRRAGPRTDTGGNSSSAALEGEQKWKLLEPDSRARRHARRLSWITAVFPFSLKPVGWEPDDKQEAEPREVRRFSWGPQPGPGGTGFTPRPSDSGELLSAPGAIGAPGSGAVGCEGPRSPVLCTLARTWNPSSEPRLSYQQERPCPVSGLLGGAVSGGPGVGAANSQGRGEGWFVPAAPSSPRHQEGLSQVATPAGSLSHAGTEQASAARDAGLRAVDCGLRPL